MNDKPPRTPEAIIETALLATRFAQLPFTRQADYIMRALKESGFSIEDELGPERRYTKEEVSAVLNQAADVFSERHDYESSETIREDDTVNLMVNLAAYWLEHPEASLEEAIAAQYASVEPDEDDLDEGEEMPEKGSPRWNELVAATVLGWTE